jgi:acetyl esterase/lipase
VPAVVQSGRRLVAAAALLLALAVARAQQSPVVPISPPTEPGAIALGTGGVNGSVAAESWFRQDGKPFVRNVARATLQPFLPDPAKATGTAVIVAPGGGFVMLSMDNEGWAVARALADQGIAAFVLKYRLRPTPADMAGFEAAMAAMFANAGDPAGRLKPDELVRDRQEQIADARAAFALVRSRAREWNIDPTRIGMIGFSAGAMTTMMTTLAAPETKPAFIGPIYGSMEAVKVPPDAPPLFAVIAADDPLFAKKGFGLLDAWQAAGRPVEFHMYQAGGHGFGLGKQGTTSPDWFPAFLHWLRVSGFFGNPARQ